MFIPHAVLLCLPPAPVVKTNVMEERARAGVCGLAWLTQSNYEQLGWAQSNVREPPGFLGIGSPRLKGRQLMQASLQVILTRVVGSDQLASDPL